MLQTISFRKDPKDKNKVITRSSRGGINRRENTSLFVAMQEWYAENKKKIERIINIETTEYDGENGTVDYQFRIWYLEK